MPPWLLTDGFFGRPDSGPHRESTFISFSLVLRYGGKNLNARITDKVRQILKFSYMQQNWSFWVFGFDVLLCTCDNCGLFQLTGTKALELEPEEVEEVLLVTAITFGFPFLPAVLCWSPYLFPIIGVYKETKCQCLTQIFQHKKVNSISMTFLFLQTTKKTA